MIILLGCLVACVIGGGRRCAFPPYVLLYAAQHSVTREEMANQFALAEKINQEGFGNLKLELKTLNAKYDRILWVLFSGMLAIFFKDFILGAFA